jgi:hypothetical protein
MNLPESKVCRLCGVEKSLEDFYRARGSRDGYRSECKGCNLLQRKATYPERRDWAIARAKAWAEANRERYLQYQEEYRQSGRKALSNRKSHLKRKFGMSLEDYQRLLTLQGGRCAICGDPPPADAAFHVDHDHETGAVRGLLCVRCNNGLGQFREDPQLLVMASQYVDYPEAIADAEVARRRLDALKARVAT